MKRFLSLLTAFVLVLSMIPAVSFAAEARTVYLDPVNGADTNTGLTDSAPVKTVTAAYAALEGASEGTVVFLDTLVLTAQTTFPSCSIPVTLTSKTGSEGITSNANAHILFGGDTILEQLTMTSPASTATYISAEGHDLTIGEGVSCKNSYYCLTGCYGAGSVDGLQMTVKSGTWRNVLVAGYKSANTGNASLTMTGGTVTNLLAPTFSGTLTGNVTMDISGAKITRICAAPNETGVVTGNVDITLGDGVSGILRIKRLYQNATVNGTVTATIDGDCSGLTSIIHEGTGKGSITETRLVLKSGILDVPPCTFDNVSVEIPTGKTLTLAGCDVTADTVNSQGTLVFSGAASLTAESVTGKLVCDISGTPVENQVYVTAPAGSDITFPASTGVTEENGVWQGPGAFDESSFKGLVIRAEKGVTVNLYSEYKPDTGSKQTPSFTLEKDNQVSYYYAGIASGPYRCVSSQSGYYKLTKNIYMSAAEVGTCTEYIVKMDKRAGGTATDSWEVSSYHDHTDEILALEAYNADISQWPEYADVFTTPWFTEEHAAQQMTTQAQAEAFIEKLDDDDDNMYIFSIGTSGGYGHTVWAVFFTQTDLSSAETYEEAVELMGQDKPAVLYRAQIHGNEPAAGEAALAMLQRLDGAYGEELIENINVVMVPRASPDGARNYARTLVSGVDPNRDMLRLESQEITDYVKLYNALMPELVIDGHEYDGYANNNYHWDSDITVGLHYTSNHTDAYAQENMKLAKGIFAAMAQNGLSYNYYSSRVNSANDFNISRPYFGQQGCLSILLETRGNGAGLVSYARRIISQVVSVEYLLSYVSEQAQSVQQLVDTERQHIVDNGATYREDDKVYLYITTNPCTEEKFTLNRIYQDGTEKLVSLTPSIFNNVQRSRTAPTAYVIPAGATFTQRVLELMDKQGIAYTYIPAGATVLLRQYTGTVTEADLTEEKSVTFGSGAYVFTMNQIPAYILATLMEPDVNDVAENAGTLAQQGIITPVGGYFPIYRYCHDLNANGFINYTTSDAEPAHVTVYLDSTNGLDTNDGLTEANAVKTMEQAYAAMATALNAAGEGSTGTVVIIGMYNLGNKPYDVPSVGFPVTVTGKTGADGLKFTGASGQEPSNRSIRLHGETTFRNLTIFADSAYAHNFILANGHKLVIDEGVNSICREGKAYYFTLIGGSYDYDENVQTTDLTVKSGTWRAVYVGGYRGSVTGTAKLEISNATVYADIFAASVGNVGKVEMNISNTTVATGNIYAGTSTANSPKKIGFVQNGTTITLGENVIAPNLYCSAKTYGGISGGVTIITKGVDLTQVPICARYSDLSASYTTDWILVKLGADMATDMTLDPTMELDLNGHNVTGNITVDGTLSVKDSQTDDFTVEDGIYGKITGSVTGKVAASEGYVAVNGQSFHRFVQRISHVSIRPSIAGVYYSGTWYCDEVLKEQIQSFGVIVSLEDMPNANFRDEDPETEGQQQDSLWTVFERSELVTGKAMTGAMITGIFKSTQQGADADRIAMNAEYGKMSIYAKTYITLENGETLVSGDDIQHSLYTVMQGIDELITEDPVIYAGHQKALQAFYDAWKDEGMDAWSFNNIG